MSLRSLVFALLRCKEYDHEADIYSFGIMLWEMWYGKKVLFEEEEHVSDQESKGARPLYVQGVIKPPTDWQDLMLLCWDGKPCNRPDAAVSQAMCSPRKFTYHLYEHWLLGNHLKRISDLKIELLVLGKNSNWGAYKNSF